MIVFRNEQYLPCAVPEIAYTRERREILDRDAPLYLADRIYIYPMNAGYLLDGRQGEFLVDSTELLESVQGRSVNEICRTAEDCREVEEYLCHGLVGFEKKKDMKLIFPNIDRKYLRIEKNENSTWYSQIPLKIELDITHQCNLKCKHCSREASSSTPTGKMSLQDLVDVIIQAGEIGIPELSLMGGEPTFHPAFIELATLAKMSGIRTLFTSTNGWLVGPKLAGKMATIFDSIQVSIHGPNSNIHDGIVGREGAFDRACRAVRLLLEQGVPSLNISCTLMKENAPLMGDMVRLAQELKVPSIRFLMLFSKGRGVSLNQWKNEEKPELSDHIRKFRETTAGNFQIEGGGVPPYSAIKSDAVIYGCPAGRSLMYINADGDVTPCGNLNHVVGDVRQKKILDLWHSPAMRALRKKPSCNCPYSEICAGGCLGSEKWGKMFRIDTQPILT